MLGLDGVVCARGDVGVAGWGEGVGKAFGGEVGGAFEDVDEALGGVLGRGMPPGASSAVYWVKAAPAAGEMWTMALAFSMPGSGGADEGVRRVQEVVALVGAAGLA